MECHLGCPIWRFKGPGIAEQTILEVAVEQSQTLATVPKVAVELAEIVPAVLKLQ